jgi:hypothetical protein
MLNLAGPQFDVANDVHAVLAECEHRRKAVFDVEECAQRKLFIIRTAFEESHGDPEYWTVLEAEVMNVAMARYASIAKRQTELEKTNYGVWRGGDLAARIAFTLAGLTVGGIIVAVPFIPIFIDAFAFFLAFCGWFYPELKKLHSDFTYTRRLNAIVNDAAKYQRSTMQYLSMSALEKALER